MSSQARLQSIDALRGLAMLLMIQQHLGVWLVDREAYAEQLQLGWAYVNMSGGIAAPLFITLAGVGVRVGRISSKQLAHRGLFLLALGCGLNLLVPSWFSWGSFYVLHLLGMWLLIAAKGRPALDALDRRGLFPLLGLGVVAAAVLGQTLLETPIHLSNPMMEDLSRPGGPLRLALLEGQFPLFPWLAFALGGYWAGRRVQEDQGTQLLQGALVCLIAALLCRSLVFVQPYATLLLPWRAVCRFSFYPLSSALMLGLFALCLALLALFRKSDRNGRFPGASWLVPLGRSSLTALFVHVVLFREVLERLGWRKSGSPLLALGIILIFVLLWAVLARAWSKTEYAYGLEWWLRRAG